MVSVALCYTRVLHMVLAMSRPFKHPRTGIYWFRKRVPADLVQTVGRVEITGSLDTRDPDEAKARIIEKLGELERRWANLRSSPQALTEREAHGLARVFYDNWIEMHRDDPSLEVLWHPQYYSVMWTFQPPEVDGHQSEIPYSHIIIPAMRRFCLKQAEFALEFTGRENTPWNRAVVGKAIAAAMNRAHVVLQRMAQGIFEPGDEPPDPRTHPGATAHGDQETGLPELNRNRRPRSVAAATTLTSLFEGWWREAKASGRKSSTYDSYRRTFAALVAFLRHDDAAKIQRSDVISFKDHRLTSPSPRTGKLPSPKTVKDSDLSALKAVFEWAVVNGKLPENPAAGISIKLGKQPKLRSKGFTDEEAKAILTAALERDAGRENPRTAAAKKWVPWLCAFTGARVGEIAQLRREDVTERAGAWVIRITPEAGTVKTNEAREVPLHAQLIDLGFSGFVQAAEDGHLFLKPSEAGDVLGPLQGIKNRLAEFARAIVPDRNVAPNHGWRHRFKTIGMEAGIDTRILDAIQGQAARSVADTYGDVTLKTISREIAKLPPVDVSTQPAN